MAVQLGGTAAVQLEGREAKADCGQAPCVLKRSQRDFRTEQVWPGERGPEDDSGLGLRKGTMNLLSAELGKAVWEQV